MIILPANTLSSGGYEVANSVRFTRNDNGYMSRTFGTPTNRKKFTISFWLKRTSITISGGMALFGSDGGNTSTFGTIHFTPQDDLAIQAANGDSDILNLVTDRKFRDVGAWYHICVIFDTTQSTNTSRVKVFVNGTQETSFSSNTYPDQNEEFLFNMGTKVHSIGKFPYGADVLSIDGYLAEFVFIDGTTTSITDFGEFSEDSPTIWKPIDVSGLTFGNNGCYLDFEDSGDLDDDESGNTNDFTATNVAAIDQCTDTCTNNFAVPNILLQGTDITFNENNLQIAIGGTGQYGTQSTFGMTSGKWYMELKHTANTSAGNDRVMVGIVGNPTHLALQGAGPGTEGYVGSSQDTTSYGYYGDSGTKYHNSGSTSYGDTWTINDIIGIYLDCDNNKLYFSKNGTVQNSGTGISITDPASTVAGAYFFAFTDTSSYGGGVQVNFGGASCYTFSSIVSDANGFGSFEYSPSGTFDSASKDFLALCTKNLGSDGG